MKMMSNWNGKEIPYAISNGGIKVLSHPYDNLILSGCSLWPPPEIIQKLYQSRHVSKFNESESNICKSGIGFYCDLQSLNSEDAITWSVFGTISKANMKTQIKWVKDLFTKLAIPKDNIEYVEIFLWRRIPHPDTLVPGGPEIDIGIITSQTIMLCEAKWKSKISKNQGVLKNKNQIQLREEYLTKFGSILFPSISNFITLTIDLQEEEKIISNSYRKINWRDICALPSHPFVDEVQKYYFWKLANSIK